MIILLYGFVSSLSRPQQNWVHRTQNRKCDMLTAFLASYFMYVLKNHMFTDRKYVCLKYSNNNT
jgi:hypothetical protein